MVPLLAQSSSYGSMLFWCAVVIILAAVMLVAISMVRKRMMSREQGPAAGFTLADLREMRRNGKLTEAEFEVAKNQIIKGLKQKEQGPDIPPPKSS